MRGVSLEHPELGRLAFGDDTIGMLTYGLPEQFETVYTGRGYVVTSLQIGSPAPRAVMRNRAHADGAFDDTRFVGPRAVTVAVRVKAGGADCGSWPIQTMLDMLLPYMDAARRPTLRWSLDGVNDFRQLTVRGDSAPVVIESPRHPTVVMSFVGAGEITSAGPDQEQVITPSEDVEAGREYDLEHDRVYPESGGIGDRFVFHRGTRPAHFTASLYGQWVGARLKVNDVEIQFETSMSAPNRVDIDTLERTILLNGDPTDSYYDVTNFAEWSWSDLRLKRGVNRVRFTADSLGPTARAVFRWRDTWA